MTCWFYLNFFLVWRFHLSHGVELKDTPTLGSDNNPRLLSKGVNRGYDYEVLQNHVVFSYQEESEELYVGGTDYVLRLNVSDFHLIEKYSLTTTGQQECHEGPCKNVITVIEKFQDSMFVCGTNGQKPKCWKLFPSVNNHPHEIVKSFEGTGISPFIPTQNSLSLIVERDLYAAAPLDADGSSLQFRRKAGSRTNVWMHDSWVSEPTFISASWVKRVDDPDNEKIYIFFREKNSDLSPEADPWISRVARVCKVDEGGSKRFFQNMWTSFLKARLVCGFPEESLYFNRLLEIYVMPAEDWSKTRVYALFSSSWNSTAVCIYSIEMIEDIFENSTFRGFNGKIPSPRPGTCVADSKTLPWDTVNVVKDHPEMTGWVHPLHRTPFYISNHNYTKIAVDRVRAADQQMYNILILATDSGRIHKVLEAGSEPFIISETQLSSNLTVQAIKLDSKKKQLVVGFSDKISTVDLQGCEEYKDSCAGCVLARDPYCSWTAAHGCSRTVPGGIQNIMSGNTSVCHTPGEEKRSKRQTVLQKDSETVHLVPQGVPFYLSCPIDSYHAKYTWDHGGQKSDCLQMLSNCLYLIPSMKQENYGRYDCISKERDFTKIVKKYRLEQQAPKEKRIYEKVNNNLMNKASGLAPQIAWTLLQNVVLWGILDHFFQIMG